MKTLIKKLILSMLHQCVFLFSYIYIGIMFEYSNWRIDGWIGWLILLLMWLIVQGIVYKLYIKPPLENDTYKGSYLVINGIFIVLETDFLFGALG